MKNTRKYKDLRNWHWSYQLDIFKALWWWWWWWWRWWWWWLWCIKFPPLQRAPALVRRAPPALAVGSRSSSIIRFDHSFDHRYHGRHVRFKYTAKWCINQQHLYYQLILLFCWTAPLPHQWPPPLTSSSPSKWVQHPLLGCWCPPYWVAPAPAPPPIPCRAASQDRMHFWRSHHCH